MWPGFEARRVVVFGDKRFDVFCCAWVRSVGGSTALMLWSSGREDERFTVDGETTLSLVVDSARLWSGFQARRVVVDGEMICVCMCVCLRACGCVCVRERRKIELTV